MKLGRAKRWDVVHISNQVYSEYPPYLKKFDVLRMAEKKVLNIPPPVVDYNYRNIVAKSTQVTVAAYNNALISRARSQTSGKIFSNLNSRDKNLWRTSGRSR